MLSPKVLKIFFIGIKFMLRFDDLICSVDNGTI